jgi:hypothetical protein
LELSLLGDARLSGSVAGTEPLLVIIPTEDEAVPEVENSKNNG